MTKVFEIENRVASGTPKVFEAESVRRIPVQKFLKSGCQVQELVQKDLKPNLVPGMRSKSFGSRPRSSGSIPKIFDTTSKLGLTFSNAK